jgi:uracil-DNA glycosylase family 4
MRPAVIVTLGNFATRYILEEQIGITRARGRRYSRRGATVIPTFHPAAALRGGRFGGLSPVDAIRQDLRVAKEVLDTTTTLPRPPAVQVEPEQIEAGAAQLGLF